MDMGHRTLTGGRDSGSKPRILIVEDEAIIGRHLEVTLKQGGFAVAGRVDTGEASIIAARDEHPDLVLMDIRLKGEISGIEAAQEIHDRFQIPIIYLTAYGDLEGPEGAVASLEFPRLSKPFSEDEITSLIDRYLSGKNN